MPRWPMARGRAWHAKMRQAMRGAPDGFSYVEVLVALAVAAVMAAAAFDWQIGAVHRTARLSQHSAAVAWAMGEVEYLRRQCFERLAPGRREVTPGTALWGEPPLPPGLGAAEVVLAPEGPALLRATVAVYGRGAGRADAARAPLVETTTLIGDVRIPGQCP